jgi:hypothetical protein
MTNLALLVALLLAIATGTGAVAAGSSGGRWVAITHGIVGVAVVLLVPWKTRIIRRGLRRARASRWASLLLAALAAAGSLRYSAQAQSRACWGVPTGRPLGSSESW